MTAVDQRFELREEELNAFRTHGFLGPFSLCSPEEMLEMKPGEFILFNERTVHHSDPNRSQRRRLGLAVRVIIPIVKVLKWDAPGHSLVRISGEDRMGFNKVIEPS